MKFGCSRGDLGARCFVACLCGGVAGLRDGPAPWPKREFSRDFPGGIGNGRTA
jgi:hypothetical protein